MEHTNNKLKSKIDINSLNNDVVPAGIDEPKKAKRSPEKETGSELWAFILIA